MMYGWRESEREELARQAELREVRWGEEEEEEKEEHLHSSFYV